MIHVVLYEPEIPQNTGNIMRTCAATNVKLHLIEPLGFKLDKANIKRSGTNYIEFLDYVVYKNWDEFIAVNKGEFFYLSRYGNKVHSDIDFKKTKDDIYLIFGNESSGIAKEILEPNYERCFRMPMNEKVRTLNLSNTVSIMVYEVLRQLDYPDLLTEVKFNKNELK